jgi:hypothetical protein
VERDKDAGILRLEGSDTGRIVLDVEIPHPYYFLALRHERIVLGGVAGRAR